MMENKPQIEFRINGMKEDFDSLSYESPVPSLYLRLKPGFKIDIESLAIKQPLGNVEYVELFLDDDDYIICSGWAVVTHEPETGKWSFVEAVSCNPRWYHAKWPGATGEPVQGE